MEVSGVCHGGCCGMSCGVAWNMFGREFLRLLEYGVE